jgi:hypothetical protein
MRTSAIYIRCDAKLIDALDQARNRYTDATAQNMSRGEMARRLLERLLLQPNGSER